MNVINFCLLVQVDETLTHESSSFLAL